MSGEVRNRPEGSDESRMSDGVTEGSGGHAVE